jgi:hypothetical protein
MKKKVTVDDVMHMIMNANFTTEELNQLAELVDKYFWSNATSDED